MKSLGIGLIVGESPPIFANKPPKLDENIPKGALQDADGYYLLDADGDYIITTEE